MSEDPQILSRAQALSSNSARYFTGQPCRRGHYAERYTVNGGCVECMAQNNNAVREEKVLGSNPRRDAVEQLAKVGMRLYHEDVPAFTELATAMVVARFPILTRQDVVGKAGPTACAAGTGFYPFRVHPDEVQMLRDVASAYRSARTVGTAQIFAARMAAAAEIAAKERDTGAGEWKFT